MSRILKSIVFASLTVVLFLQVLPLRIIAQEKSGEDGGTWYTSLYREDSIRVLRMIGRILEDRYYDKDLRGVDLDRLISDAEKKIKTLNHNWQMYRVIAQVLIEFDDSHTRLLLPGRRDFFDYGVTFQMIGNECYIVRVRKGSDAEAKGLRPGHKVELIGNYRPNRNDLWKILLVMNKLDPAETATLKVRDLDNAETVVTIAGRTFEGSELRKVKERSEELVRQKPYKCAQLNNLTVACKLWTFSTTKGEIQNLIREIKPFRKLILDLRGNSGGYVNIGELLVGSMFSKNVKIGDYVTRKKKEELVAKGQGDEAFNGELLVLTDSRSASAAEVFARVVQIEKRGRVVGDFSRGAVMTSISLPLLDRSDLNVGKFRVPLMGVSVTIGDLIMSDGSRLERMGVEPDLPVIPSPEALSLGTDPVLAYAAAVFETPITPDAAGQLRFLHRDDYLELDD